MNVQKVSYWKISPSQAISDNWWGRRVMEDLAAELGIEDLKSAYFTTLAAAQEVAQRLLVKWDEAWPWDADHREVEVGKQARTTYQKYHNSPIGVYLTRGGETCTSELVKTKKTVIVDGEEYTRVVEEVILGEWTPRPYDEQVLKVETWRQEISIIS